MLQSARLQDQQLQDASDNNPPLSIGSQGEGVKILQTALRDLGHEMPITFASGEADGQYGQESFDAVTAFQADCAFDASGQDGIAGTDTLAALDAIFLLDERLTGLDDLKARWFLD